MLVEEKTGAFMVCPHEGGVHFEGPLPVGKNFAEVCWFGIQNASLTTVLPSSNTMPHSLKALFFSSSL